MLQQGKRLLAQQKCQRRIILVLRSITRRRRGRRSCDPLRRDHRFSSDFEFTPVSIYSSRSIAARNITLRLQRRSYRSPHVARRRNHYSPPVGSLSGKPTRRGQHLYVNLVDSNFFFFPFLFSKPNSFPGRIVSFLFRMKNVFIFTHFLFFRF